MGNVDAEPTGKGGLMDWWGEQQRLNDKHANHPQAGDIWTEMLVPVFKVIQVDEKTVVVQRPRYLEDGKYWTWDGGEIQVMTREEFKRYLSYDTIPGYWATIIYERRASC